MEIQQSVVAVLVSLSRLRFESKRITTGRRRPICKPVQFRRLFSMDRSTGGTLRLYSCKHTVLSPREVLVAKV